MSLESRKADAIPSFSLALETAIAEVLPSDDPLDSLDFDPIEYINNLFPDEANLGEGRLEEFVVSLKHRINDTQDQITKDVRDFSCTRARTEMAVRQAQDSMHELFGKIKAIEEKANQSESIVQEICRDIKSLDFAKKNLTLSIQALRNLHMLTSAVEQLARMVEERQWRDAASLLKAINDLLSLFKDFENVSKIADLTAQVNRYKQQIKTQVFGDFQALVPSSPLLSDRTTQQRLRDECLCIDVLQPEVKTEILSWFSKTLLQPYLAVFAPGQEGGNLEQTERRFAWLRRTLKSYDENFALIFPDHWCVRAVLSREFCHVSADHLKDLLRDDSTNTALIIRVLQRTIEFEHELNVRFKSASLDEHIEEAKDLNPFQGMAGEEDNSEGTMANEAVTVAIREKYKAKEAVGEESSPSSSFDFDRLISEKFAPYLSGVVEMERGNLNDLVDRLRREEKWAPDAEDLESLEKRLAGSDDLFVYVKKSSKRCAKLTNKGTFFSVFVEYRRGLSLYADLLRSRISQAPNPPPTTTRDTVALCLLANTAEYCNELIPSLEGSIKRAIDDAFKDRVTLASNQEEFSVLLNLAVKAIANGICAHLQQNLDGMARMPWSTWQAVGDQSAYVNELNALLHECLPTVHRMLSVSYHNFFCTQLVAAFIPRFVDAINKCRRINQTGAQQMQMDAHALKTVLLDTPNIMAARPAADDDARDAKRDAKKKGAAARAFGKFVNKEMGQAEALLKTLGSPAERLIDTFKTLMPDASAANSAEDLGRIMNLRGLKRTEQQVLVDTYNANVGPSSQVKLTAGAGLAQLFTSFSATNFANKV